MFRQLISLSSIELIQLNLPQKKVFQSGIGTRVSKETLLVKWTDREGRVGYGECSCRPDPYYSSEFLKGAWYIIKDFVIPNLKPEQDYETVLKVLDRIRGWNFTKSGVESALFQVGKQIDPERFNLNKILKAPRLERVPAGISLGIFKDKKVFFEVVQEAIASGYHRLKFKISPESDLTLFEHINPLLFKDEILVRFDANGSFGLNDLEKLRYFVDTYSGLIEQPMPPDRYDLLSLAKEKIPNLRVCFDEEVKSIGDLIKLHTLGVVDELNLKIGRVGGISSSIRIMNYCFDNEIPCWMGGMFETGVGRLQNLELAGFLTFAKAHDLSPSNRFFKEDIVAPVIEMEAGFIHEKSLEECQVVPEIIEKYTVEKEVFKF